VRAEPWHAPCRVGRDGWAGPCPPSGTHRYVFTVYALSEPLGLGPGAEASAIRRAMAGKVLAALTEGLGLGTEDLATAREVLRDCGNMSSATVLFVLERELRRAGGWRRGLMIAVGPGFTAGFLLIEAPPR
jgi:hypothetical protein